jgi:60 kDa SS-A/Ro ribonucleoprotein
MKTNKKVKAPLFSSERLAGGFGMASATQSNLAALKRLVSACLLWENNAYVDGETIVSQIKALIPTVKTEDLVKLVVDTRHKQGLRHVPLLMLVEMLKHPAHKKAVRQLIPLVCDRPDQLTELLSLYWLGGKTPLANALKEGMADTLTRFSEYQLAKWNKDGAIKLRDILFLTHAKPKSPDQEALFKKLVDGSLATPDTWEVELSQSKDKKGSWTRLIEQKKLGQLATLMNLRNMVDAGVSKTLIRQAISQVKPERLLPINFIRAAEAAPDYLPELEELMLRSMNNGPQLKGETIFVLDVSGSMGCAVSAKSKFSRLDAGIAMAIMAKGSCEHCTVYLTAGSDITRVHKTVRMPNLSGFGLATHIKSQVPMMGGGGIFTRQCLDFIKGDFKETPDRILVFSDSQDCDLVNKVPSPFGTRNYIVDVSSHKNGINYRGVWTAEISGWSTSFIDFIADTEGVSLQ